MANKHLRTTIIIEAGNAEDFEWAFQHAEKLARQQVIHMSFHKEGDPLTRYEVRTTKARPRKDTLK
jgi:hypothetical protein